MLPEGERQVEVVTEIDETIEGESQLVVLQEFEHGREVDVREACQAEPGCVKVGASQVPAGLKCLAINGHGISFGSTKDLVEARKLMVAFTSTPHYCFL